MGRLIAVFKYPVFEQTIRITIMNTSIIPFHGDTLYLVEHNGEPYAPMRPIVEAMGMDWKTQYRKMIERFKTCVVKMTMQLPGDNQTRSVVCLALRKLPGWLQTITPNKVRPEIRATVIQYQEECDDALWSYWNKGIAIRPEPATVRTLTPQQKWNIQNTVKQRVALLPKEQQAGAYPQLYGALKNHFMVAKYEEIPQPCYREAVSVINSYQFPAVIEPPKEEGFLVGVDDGVYIIEVRGGRAVQTGSIDMAAIQKPLGLVIQAAADLLGLERKLTPTREIR